MRTWIAALTAAGIILAGAAPALANWKAANATVEAAAKDPVIAAVLAATVRMDEAILKRDAEAFGGLFDPAAVVNSPYNNVATRDMAMQRIRNGMIDYTSLERSIEFAARRGAHDVILMGEERYTPVGVSQYAGQVLRRRTSELWSNESGGWKLVLRQATVIKVEPMQPK
ncbi:nuclear transport factor 2 family protein [Sandaracinobacteroides saxicola]|uniref:Nuclear transport factor 2 family protein n=1 Tax=Sandaracinobacteroides saxicola TaxID=2759707 RepID=A0A7G5IF92_9SPHN|nr:nuclear transport factor 2 family protein [Sandaracinobacteroides saxicola]QMW22034.1 nuclear transport factor 2 family protein [Sandaracinobacteroides saxicola]